ncbi:MAG TPA: nucleoside monophosphate kinase [Terriglobales bacterium]|nr:nucleoside monophosphate kinase [Terriglobales bacterium]
MPSSASKNRAAWLEGSKAVCAPRTEFAHPWRLILLGAPGVGKGTQADLLCQRLGTCHLSTGDVFRSASQSACEPSPAMKAALDCMHNGDLVPDSIVWDMVRERTICLRCRGGFILDGFPRTLMQAESLAKLMHDEHLLLDAVVNYELPPAEIVDRLSGRRTCEKCKAVYHITRQPSRAEGICDRCGGKLYQREDDRPDAVKVRMETYEHSTEPLIQFYRELGVLLPVAATGSPEEIYTRTADLLQRNVGR